MSVARQTSAKGNWITRLWRFFWRPNSTIALGVLLIAGFIGGILFWGGFHLSLDATNTEEFCISCHEMRDNPYEEMKDTVHFLNRTGNRSACPDCHVPHAWAVKVAAKIAASAELYGHLIGRLDTPEKYEHHRLSMAVSIWDIMKKTDSRECRHCHLNVWVDMNEQFGSARRAHEFAIENDLTCIDCHQGIAHNLPKEFKAPTNEQLAADAGEWLAEMKELAAAQEQRQE